jgi:hypothetical protein
MAATVRPYPTLNSHVFTYALDIFDEKEEGEGKGFLHPEPPGQARFQVLGTHWSVLRYLPSC